MRGVEGVCVLL